MLPKTRSAAARLVSAALLMHCACAIADSSGTRAAAVKLDGGVQALKQEALQFNRDAASFERDIAYPAHSRVAVYLGVRLNNFMVQEIRVSIDNGAVQKIVYDDKQSRALFQGSNIDRLFYANASPGPHRLHAEYVARYDRSGDAQPITGSYDAFFDKGSDPVELELVIAQGRSKTKPALMLKEWRRLK
jgi:hypothetical protein